MDQHRPSTPSQSSYTASTTHYRLGGMTGFIPLNEESTTISTRGQRLPSLLQTRSSTSLFTTSRRDNKRPGSFIEQTAPDEDDEDRGPLDGSLMQESPPLTRRRTIVAQSPDLEANRRTSHGQEILNTPQMRSMRLIGKSNPRYHWHQYYKTEEQLKKMTKPLKEYYERCNYLISQYIYIDKLLDSSLPHDLIQEYTTSHAIQVNNMETINEEQSHPNSGPISATPSSTSLSQTPPNHEARLKRTPKDLYKLPDEHSPLLSDEAEQEDEDEPDIPYPEIKYESEDEDLDANSPVVTVAIYINLVANVILLASKIAVIALTSSLSVLASLVDAALDFLSTAIVWTTTKLISRQDSYAYPIGRRRLEPVGVLVFSVIMITSFFQVALECIQRLASPDHSIVYLGIPAIAIMVSTVVIKGFCWFWCRLVKNSSVQALAQDAATDVVFNTFSIIFPLVGFYAKIWWLDALGGLLLSLYVIFNWSSTSSVHVRNLCGAAATADQRNVLLYLTMRFAKTIKHIQGLQAYHAGDKLNVEVDIVLDENMNLRDSHDLSESLQYVLESVPTVDRAFVHADYGKWNLPSHMNQQA